MSRLVDPASGRSQGGRASQEGSHVVAVRRSGPDPCVRGRRGLGPGSGLTDWDRSYLTALYEHDQLRINRNSQVRAVAEAVTRDRREAAETAPE